MMREVLERRFKRLIEAAAERRRRPEPKADDEPFPQWPDLVLIDGGHGQLNAAREIFADLGVTEVPLIGIAKGPDRDAGRETFFMPGREPFKLQPRDPVLYFVQRLRDEAHRFAIGSHRKQRKKDIREAGLQEIPGIGPTRKRALLHHFGTLKAIERASVADLGRFRASAPKPPARSMIFSTPSRAEMTAVCVIWSSPAAAHLGAARLTFSAAAVLVRRMNIATTKGSPARALSLPNILTYARIAAVPVVVGCITQSILDGPLWLRWVALAIFIAAGITDYLDGYLRATWQQQSAFGRMLDPIADKLLVASCLLMLAADGTIRGWSLWAAIVILCREILVSGLREYLAELRVSVPVTRLAKWKTTVQLIAVGFLLAGEARRADPSRAPPRSGSRCSGSRRSSRSIPARIISAPACST